MFKPGSVCNGLLLVLQLLGQATFALLLHLPSRNVILLGSPM